jgi:hypothetical protein
MTTPNTDLLDRVRALLAKAEVTEYAEEAESLTAKASELMAKYGIDRALLGAIRPESDKPADKKFAFEAPWADVKAHLLAAVATALRCQCVQTQTEDGPRLHVFGYQSDLDRAELLFTSLLVQMARALAREVVPAYGNSAKAWRRSWMLGYCAAAVARIRAAEEAAVKASDVETEAAGSDTKAELVLADRSLTVRLQVSHAYPRLKKKRVTYSGSGYGDGYREGQKADIGGGKVTRGAQRALR